MLIQSAPRNRTGFGRRNNFGADARAGRRVSALLLSGAVSVLCSGCFLYVPFLENDRDAAGTAAEKGEPAAIPTVSAAQPQAVSRMRQSPIDRLVANLSHPRAAVRVNAATDLGALGSKARPAIPALVSTLKDQSYWVRRASAKALGKIGSPSAVGPLREALRDRDKYVAQSAAGALRQIGTSDALAAVRNNGV